MEMIQHMVAETNKYYNQYLDTLDSDGGHTQLPDITVKGKYIFLAIIIQTGHDVRDTLEDSTGRLEQFCTPFYSNTMK
jgi:hypothetical protein